jgi:hypothetical protein
MPVIARFLLVTGIRPTGDWHPAPRPDSEVP